MSLHQFTVRSLGVSPVGAVMKTGGSMDLPLQTLAIASKEARKTTRRGLKVLENFEGIDKTREKLSILFGSKKGSGRYGSDKNSRSIDFTLADVKKVAMYHPKTAEATVDYFRVGWDGINDDTSFKFKKGQTLELQLTIGGVAASFLGSDCYTVRQLISIPNAEFNQCDEVDGFCDPVDCREHTIKMVKGLKEQLLPGGYKLKEFFDIYPIFQTTQANETPIKYKQYCLSYCGFGGEHELAKVAAQYPGVEVKRDPSTNKFVIFQKADAEAPAPYVATKDSIMKGCGECPDGYALVEGGEVYAVAIEDDGEDKSAVVAGIPGAVAGTECKHGNDYGVGHYSVILTKHLTAEEEKAFVEANPTVTLLHVGSKQAFCEGTGEETHPWVECGECEASCAKYQIIVPDNCNGTRLEDLKAAYPDLEITEVKSQNCVSVFETTVETDLSCDTGCNPAIVQNVFDAKAPRMFEGHYWYPVQSTDKPEATLCGFEIKGKPMLLNPSDCLEEDVPFILSSTRIISISGGHSLDGYSMNSLQPDQPSFRVMQLEKAKDLDNLGSNLKGWVKRGQFYFSDVVPAQGNAEKVFVGGTGLDNLTQYSVASISIERPNHAGIDSKEYSKLSYKVFIPFGRTDDTEALLRELAAAAGVPFEVK